MATVMNKLIDHCRLAFQSKQPFILIDTEELELVNELVLECSRTGSMVDLIKKEHDHSKKHRPFYTFIGAASEEGNALVPGDLKDCINLYSHMEALQALQDQGSGISNDNKSSGSVYILHLTEEDQKTLLPRLRSYANKYLSCYDPSSTIRDSCVFLYGNPDLMPKDLKQYTEIVTVEYPDQTEIAEICRRMAEEQGYPFKLDTDLKTVARELAGFSRMDVIRVLRRLLWTDHLDGQPILHGPKARKKMILDFKKQSLLKTGGLLELVEADEENKNTLGGMDSYKKYVNETIRDKVLEPYKTAIKKGTPPPKGVLLCGVPGCGKSEAAKILHAAWDYKLPLLKMDIDRLMNSLVGESERHMRETLKQAEAMSPCILWIDELDKGFSGAASSGSGDGGTFKRMFGRLLTWMQENKTAVFIFATANDTSQLPAEFFRNGRYDARFAVFMPTHAECKAIFKEHMNRAEKLRAEIAAANGEEITDKLFDDSDNGCFSNSCLDDIMKLFTKDKDLNAPVGIKFVSGADIRLIVNTALGMMTEEDTMENGQITKIADIKKPLSAARWIELVEEALNSPFVCTQGDSVTGLNQIAECYARLLRGQFVPSSDEKQVLFKKENYDSGNKTYLNQPPVNCPDYDTALYNALYQCLPAAIRHVESMA